MSDPKPEAPMFSFKEIAAALVRQAELHEGRWAVVVEFGLGAGNVVPPSGNLVPAAIITMLKLGLRRVENLDDLSVDAAEVNPATKGAPTSKRRRKQPA